MRGAGSNTKVPDLKNGATKKTEETEKTFFVLYVCSAAPFLRSGTFVTSPMPAGQLWNQNEKRMYPCMFRAV